MTQYWFKIAQIRNYQITVILIHVKLYNLEKVFYIKDGKKTDYKNINGFTTLSSLTPATMMKVELKGTVIRNVPGR